MALYDFERLQNDLRTILQTHLPGRITAINSEKNDGLTLAAPANGNYFLDKHPDSGNQTSPWVIIGADQPIEVETLGGNFRQEFSILVTIGSHSASNLPQETVGSMFKRYTRAIMETIAQNFNGITGHCKLKMQIIPTPVPYGASPGTSMLVGQVRVNATI